MKDRADTLSLPAPAKLNLFLHITGRRADGYHQLQTVFQILDVGDELRFTRRSDGAIRLHCEGPEVLEGLADADNLVLRAARALVAAVPDDVPDDLPGDLPGKWSGEAPRPVPGADITLLKRLPAGGGLGGGSSDAASTLLGLNALWRLDLGIDTLAELGAKLGADVPVFVRGRSAWAEGIGEELTALQLEERWYLIIHPGCAVATAEIFSHPELTRDTPAITIPAFFAGHTRNDCEPVVRRLAEPVDKALIWLQKFGSARMTGSGACVFAGFDSEGAARAVAEQLPGTWQGFVARGVNRSPAHEQLDRYTC